MRQVVQEGGAVPDSAPVAVELGLGHLVKAGGEAGLELPLVVVQVAGLPGSVVEHLVMEHRHWQSVIMSNGALRHLQTYFPIRFHHEHHHCSGAGA